MTDGYLGSRYAVITALSFGNSVVLSELFVFNKTNTRKTSFTKNMNRA